MKKRLVNFWLLFFPLISFSQQIQFDSLWQMGTDLRERNYYARFDHEQNLYMIGSTNSNLNFDITGGINYGNNNPSTGYYFARYKPNLQLDWSYYLHYSESQMYCAILRVDKNNKPIIGGIYRGSIDIDFRDQSMDYLSPSTNASIFVARFDTLGFPDGHFELVALPDSFNTMLGDNPFLSDITIDHHNNYILSGYSGEVYVPSTNTGDTIKEFNYFVIKLDENFQVKWIRRLPKVVREFHNWTNSNHIFVSVDKHDDVYVSTTLCDSMDITGQPQNLYVSAKPYDYWQPPSNESANIDALVVKYDKNGNYIRHRLFTGMNTSAQRMLDAIMLEDNRFVAVCSFSHSLILPNETYIATGFDSVSQYNVALIEMDTTLNVIQSKRYYNNIATPCPEENYLQTDECGNLFLRIDKLLANFSGPFPFANPAVPVINCRNIYFVDKLLNLTDCIYYSGYDLSDNRYVTASYGSLATIGTFWNYLTMDSVTIHELNYISGTTGFDNFLLIHTYDNCRKADPQTTDYVFELPNVFSPGSDHMNDFFTAKKMENISDVNISIYNRWGNLIHQGHDETVFWDGKTSSGKKCEDGVYYYVINFIGGGMQFKRNGTIMLCGE